MLNVGDESRQKSLVSGSECLLPRGLGLMCQTDGRQYFIKLLLALLEIFRHEKTHYYNVFEWIFFSLKKINKFWFAIITSIVKAAKPQSIFYSKLGIPLVRFKIN